MDMKKILQALDGADKKSAQGSNDMKKFMSIVTEGTNRQTVAEQMIVQEYTKPNVKKQGNGIINKYFDAVLRESEEEILEKKARASVAAKRAIARMEESKQEQAPKPRNFVAKNAKTAGAGAHKDKKKALKQGDVKHKGKAMDMAEVSLGNYRKKAAMDKALATIDAKFSHDPAKQAKAQHTIAKREKGLSRADDRSSKELAAMATKRKSEHEAMLKDKYAGVDIDAEIARLQPAIKSAYDDYQYGASNTWRQGKDRYDQLTAKVRELEKARELLGGADLNEEGDEDPSWSARMEGLRDPKDNPCWKGYHPVGTKKKGGKTVPNCVPNKKG